MPHRYFRCLFFLSMLFSCMTLRLRAQEENIYWYGDYREAVQQAKQTHRPLFVEFRCEA
jgi:hypothetical protein